jgi:hypothetical protein
MNIILVCGGRDYANTHALRQSLDEISGELGGVELLVHGDATGADTLAKEWAISRGITQQAFPAQWDVYGRAAGPIRNSEMASVLAAFANEGHVCTGVAFPGGSGTRDMVKKLEGIGVDVIEVDDSGCTCGEVHQ